tara:strand:- start:40060 stop:42081 length:2022 start_codon:yes stop_codon:yes gene_type:complete
MHAQVSKEDLNLMPWPKEVKLGEGQFLLTEDFSLTISGTFDDRIFSSANSFLRRLDGRTGLFFKQGIISKHSKQPKTSIFKIEIQRKGIVALNEDESYELTISESKIILKATTDIGAIRGLETLLQLQTNTETEFYFPVIEIQDAPRFPWRGLMIDVSRHFQPVAVLKRNLDAMAAVKMNIFHWHLSDDQGFRVEIKKHPKLTELGSDGLYYTQAQIKEVVAYASARGILVVPEIDVPGHASAILAAYPELGSKKIDYSIERSAGIFNPTLDPTNKNTYKLLADIFKEISTLFPGRYVHIGGDENEGKEWDENKSIQKFMEKKALKTNHDLQTYFNIKLQKILGKLDKELIGWEEIMTPNMPKSAIIHSWRGVNEGLPAKQSLVNAAKNNYKTILSNGYYIDLLYSVEDHYLVDPLPEEELTDEEEKRILGGEATMWTELATPSTIDSRIWPRTAAIAERFWSPKNTTNMESMYRRLGIISFQLEELGLQHIYNKDVIFRNLSNNQPIESLRFLSEMCEPLKGYTRNKGGIEYQMYAPFTLFADACSADAYEGRGFDKKVQVFLSDKSNKEELIQSLSTCSSEYKEFINLKSNPKLKKITPMFYNLATVSEVLIQIIQSEKIEESHLEELNNGILKMKENHVDVEFSILKSLEKLQEHFNTVLLQQLVVDTVI